MKENGTGKTEQRLIDANNLSVMIEETAQGLTDCDQQNAAWALRKYAIRDITEAPTVDAVEAVRCRDCKHYMTIHCTCDGCCISDDWYCADGERRTDHV